jgi:mono/diheme cytochrome c family protein
MKKIYIVSAVLSLVVILSYGAVNTKAGATGIQGKERATVRAVADSMPKKIKKDEIARDIERLMMDVPPSFSPADSARLIANWRLGIKFYKAKCASCHGIFGKGKDSIPNFSKEEVDEYKTAYLAGDKLNHAVMAKMTEDELNAVFLFISNIKREPEWH